MAGSVRRSRWSRVCLITAGSAMLAITFIAPHQHLQGIDLEHALQPLRPRHREVARRSVADATEGRASNAGGERADVADRRLVELGERLAEDKFRSVGETQVHPSHDRHAGSK